MSKYISQYDEVVSSDSTDYYLLQRGSAYKKLTKANFFNQIVNELGIGATTLVGLEDVDTTYLSNGDVLQYNSATEMWDCVPMSGGGGASALADLTDVDLTGINDADILAYDLGTTTWMPVGDVVRGTGVANFLMKWTGTNTADYSLMTDNGSAIGLNTATYTYTFSIGGNSARSLGMVRHTTSNTAGNTFSLYAGGATSGASDKNGGNFDIYTGIATGTGTSQFNVYTVTAGASGTTDRTPSLKLNINGAGTMELTTSTANSKLRIGHNLRTVLSLSTGIGIDFSRVSDGSYTISGGIHMVDNASYRMIISSANAGVAFVKNPASDTVPFAVIGGSGGGQFWCGAGTGAYPVDFRRVFADANSSTFSYFAQTGTCSSSGNTVTTEIVNTMTNTSGRNIALLLNASSSTTDNIALAVATGDVVLGGGATVTADYLLSFANGANRSFGVNREASSNAGRKLTMYGGSAAPSVADLAGGNVEIVTGISTGTGGADIIFQTATPGSTGTTDRTPTTKMTIKGSGAVGIGVTSPHTSALLDLTSTTQGLLLPRMTTAQRTAISSPANGLMVFDTDLDRAYCYESTGWQALR